MADAKIPASADFFKQLSFDCQRLQLIIRILEDFTFRASVHGCELGDAWLLLILEQVEVLDLKVQQFMDDFEKRMWKVGVQAVLWLRDSQRYVPGILHLFPFINLSAGYFFNLIALKKGIFPHAWKHYVI
jgi:hypothetical protein